MTPDHEGLPVIAYVCVLGAAVCGFIVAQVLRPLL